MSEVIKVGKANFNRLIMLGIVSIRVANGYRARLRAKAQTLWSPAILIAKNNRRNLSGEGCKIKALMNKTFSRNLRSTRLRTATALCVFGLCNLIVSPVKAQNSGGELTISTPQNLFAMLSDRGISSALKAKDLTVAWRVMNIAGATDQTALLRMMAEMDGSRSPQVGVYYTRGDVISIAAQTYLVAYRVLPPSDPEERRRQEQYMQAWQNENGDEENPIAMQRAVPPLDENTDLSLSLISIGNGANLIDIKAFDPDKDIISAAGKAKRSVQIERAMSQSNLKQVALGVIQYMQDYDEILPPMRAARTAAEFSVGASSNPANVPVQVVLQPYLKSTQIFLHPKTGRPYLPNYKISRINDASIESPAETFLFFEDAPDAEGMRNVAFADGHVKAFTEADFQRMRKAQGISESGFPPVAPPGFKPKVKPKPPLNQRNSARAGLNAPAPPSPSPSPPPPPPPPPPQPQPPPPALTRPRS